jgi:hypothetical protein
MYPDRDTAAQLYARKEHKWNKRVNWIKAHLKRRKITMRHEGAVWGKEAAIAR